VRAWPRKWGGSFVNVSERVGGHTGDHRGGSAVHVARRGEGCAGSRRRARQGASPAAASSASARQNFGQCSYPSISRFVPTRPPRLSKLSGRLKIQKKIKACMG
jgi:hypothetical protein